VNKQTVPDGSAQAFEFDPSYGTNFTLVDGGANDSGMLEPGTYSVTEVNIPAGWDLTSATCDDGSDPGAIVLDSRETVTCTFTNTQRGYILVDKVTDPSGATTSFDFALTGGPSALNQNFSLTDADPPRDSGPIPAGSGHSVTETVPSGWDLTGATCSDGSDPSAIVLAPDETVTCTFNNTQRATMVIEKQVQHGGENDAFIFAIPNLLAGTYTSTEDDPAPGFDLTAITCDDGGSATPSTGDLGARTATFQLEQGERVTCTFTNTLQTGTIQVCKDIVPDDTSQWDFALTGPTPGTRDDLEDGGCHTFSDLVPGFYNLSETSQAGYATTIDCGAKGSDGDNDISFILDPGEDVTCTFTNTRHATLVIEKQTDADECSTTSTFDLPNLPPGSYPATEDDPAPGFDLAAITCDDGDSATPSTWDVGTRTATFNLDPAETVKCTFTNSLVAAPTGESSDSVGVGQDTYTTGETVYATGIGFVPNTNVDIYIVGDLAWSDGMAIPPDVSSDGMNTVLTDGAGDFGPVNVWPPPLTVGEFDMVFDANQNGTYDTIIDAVDDPNHPGFTARVPAPPVPVGGVIVPVDKLGVVASWMGVVALAGLAALTIALVRRRRA